MPKRSTSWAQTWVGFIMGNTHNGVAGRRMNMFGSNKQNQMVFDFPEDAWGSNKTQEMEPHGDVYASPIQEGYPVKKKKSEAEVRGWRQAAIREPACNI